jgi:hypothetical protein
MGAPPQKHCDTGAKMPLITLKNIPKSGIFATAHDPQTGCIHGCITLDHLAEKLQEELCRMTNTSKQAVAAVCGGHQLVETCNTLVIEVSYLERVDGVTYEDHKRIASGLGELANTTLNKKYPIEVHITKPLIPHENVRWETK